VIVFHGAGIAGGFAASNARPPPIHVKHCHSERSEESIQFDRTPIKNIVEIKTPKWIRVKK